MSDVPTTAADLAKHLFRSKREVDEALAAYDTAIRDDALKDDEARKAKARAYLNAKAQLGAKATVPEITSYVDLETANEQHAARLAEGLKRAAGQAVESRMRWMQALMSLSSTIRAEANLAKWTPSSVESEVSA